MTRFSYYVILFSFVIYFFCHGVTIRDRILVDTVHRIEGRALSPPSSRQIFEGAMNGMFKTLDKYSYYTPAVGKKEYNDHLNNHYDGIGLISTPVDDNKSLEVVYTIVESPAFRVGLRSGDRILAVNGKELTEEQVRGFSALIRGLSGKEIELSVLQFGKTEPVKMSIKSAELSMDSVEGDGIDASGNRDFILQTDSDIGYIRITSFSPRTADEFDNALRQLYEKHASGLVLDLRGNPGGYVDTSVKVAEMLLESSGEALVVVSTKSRSGVTQKKYYAASGGQICSIPIVVLIDGDSASASEIVAAALQDYGRVVIVGGRSFGKGVVQEIHDLPANSGTYQLTGVSYWRPSNRNIHRTENATKSDEWGVVPDFECKLELRRWRSQAIDFIRTRRANVICEDREAYLKSSIEEIEKDINKLRNEINEAIKTEKSKDDKKNTETPEVVDKNESVAVDENIIEEKAEKKVDGGDKKVAEADVDDEEENENFDKIFKLQGNAPYYDPQLDKAIDILKNMINGKTVKEILEQKE
jgi:carboxyl-terminal processing protease